MFFLKSQIPISALVSFVEALEVGYSKHKNPYHNLIHAADVTQTVHYLLLKTGMVVSSLERILISSKETNRTKKKNHTIQTRCQTLFDSTSESCALSHRCSDFPLSVFSSL